MSKVKYMMGRLLHMNYRSMFETIEKLHRKTGKSRLWLLGDMIFCGLRYGAGYMDYMLFAFYGLTPAQRGTALHLVMEQLPLDGDLSEQGVRRFVEKLVREDFLTPQQGEAIPVGQVARFYQSDLGQKLAKAKTVRREFKFSLLVDAGEYFPAAPGEELMLQGVVDLWFEDEDGVTVVDFKSDRILPGEEACRTQEYRPQLAAYSRALKTILWAEKLKTVLWFFATGTAVEL